MLITFLKVNFDLMKKVLHLTLLNVTPTLTDTAMEEETGTKEVTNGQEDKNVKEEIFTKIVRAGKRTYFFDVKATRKDDFYLTITESKKRLGKEGKVFYEKHKIFLYKEDFEKFAEGFKDAVTYIDEGMPEVNIVNSVDPSVIVEEKSDVNPEEFTNIEFEDLGKQ